MIKELPDDRFTTMFTELVESAGRQTGVYLPKHIELYCVLLLADHMRKNEWEPKPSFAECYLTLNSAEAAKGFGDECLFVCGVFPEYCQRRGMTLSYYQGLGQSAYLKASRALNPDIFEPLAQHFSIISKWILSVTRQNTFPDFK